MSNRTQFLKDAVQALKDKGVYRNLNVLEGPNEPEFMVNGQKKINLCSNNYLGFANHPRLKKVAMEALEKYGVGAGAVRTIAGNTDLHEKLDLKIAEFKREERAHHFQSGFNCNLGAIQAIMDKGDIIISDELNHASIIDGTRLSKADKAVYKHTDMNSLESVLKEKRAQYTHAMIITDGVFSMDGDIAPLPDIVALAEKYDALVYVDDAHGSGVLGENGRGTVDHFHLHGKVDFTIGTLSKAIGSVGGYVAGSQEMYDWLNHQSRTTLFSTSLPPASVAACIEAFNILTETDEYSKKLWDNTHYFKAALTKLGFDISKSQTPIVPLIIGDEAKTMEVSKALFAEGVVASGIIFPTVPKGTGRIRFMVSAAHTKELLDRAVSILEKVLKAKGII